MCQSFYFITSPRSQITFAARLASPRSDSKIGFPDSEAVIRHLKVIKPALFIVDQPGACARTQKFQRHDRPVAGEISRISAETGATALVLYHLHKGSTGEIDDLMGATALRSTFRSTRILARMTRDEAQGFKLPPAEAWRYSRIASTKENYTPHLSEPPTPQASLLRVRSPPLILPPLASRCEGSRHGTALR